MEDKMCIDCEDYGTCENMIFADDPACDEFKPNRTDCGNPKK